MRTYERDYRYLLLHLLPRHRLSTGLRRDLSDALQTGDTDELRHQAIRALEELCDAEYFERTALEAHDDDVSVAYRRRGGAYQVKLSISRTEWHRITGNGESAPGPDNVVAPPEKAADDAPGERPLAPEPSPPPSVGSDAVGYLPDIIRTFAITDRTAPVLTRLDSLLATLERWLELEGAVLHVVEDTAVSESDGHTRVRVIPEEGLRDSELLRRSIETGAQRLVPKVELSNAPNGAPAHWGVLGVAPIFRLGKVHGVLQLYFPPGMAGEAMTSRLTVAAGVVRQMVEFHNQVANLTSIDALTGLYNRHFYDTQLPVEIERAKRSGGALTMLVIDLDDFKRINDEMGHRKGDEALSTVAQIIRRNLRKIDLPFRYGGEEFVILLPGARENESIHTAERLRRVIHEHQGFRDPMDRTRVISVSVGASVYPETARGGEELFEQADRAMYRAKHRGKNQVVFYREDMGVGI